MGTALDETTDGTTELRIHGVSGTPTESMLDHPHPRRVSGDGTAGFYRRWFPAANSLDVPHGRHLEAYSWGGLTSRAASRALWLLLLPFLLVNVASWMEPGAPQAARARRRSLEALLRLFAVSLTCTLLLASAGVGMDLWAWQCGGTSCARGHALTRFLTGWPAGRRLAVGVLVPALVLALLWYLANRTWTAYESRRATQPHPGDGERVALADPRMWRGEEPVRRMRAIHLTVGWSLLAVLVAWPLADHLHETGSSWQSLPVVLLAAALLLAVLALGTLLRPAVADRETPPATLWPDAVWRLAPWVALAVLAATVVVAALPWAGTWGDQRGSLPLFVPVLVGGFLAQFGTLVAMAGLTAGLPGRGAAAMAGFAGPVVVAIGWLLAGGFAAGLALRVADYLGTPVADLAAQRAASRASDPLVVPAPYAWVGMLVPLLLLPLAVGLAVLWRRARRLTAAAVPVVGADYAAHPDPVTEPAADGPARTAYLSRRRRIARVRALAALTDRTGDVVLGIVTAVLVALAVACVAYVVAPDLPAGRLSPLTTVGTWLVGAVALLLVGLARSAYRNPQLRRTVGIAWDLGSFWPRATHPLAPPCYCERVLPDLVDRAAALTRVDTDRLVLSAHSQGTVIAVAAVLQLPQRTVERTGLLTYGAPLRRLYASYFPGYFGDATFAEAANRLGRTADAAPTTAPAEWPWRNLYRLTDPIGGFVLAPADVTADDGGTVDRQLVDPVFARPFGDSADPVVHGHSDYPADAAFAASVAVVERRLERRRGPLSAAVPPQQPATPAT